MSDKNADGQAGQEGTTAPSQEGHAAGPACSAPEEELLWLERRFEIERLLQECDGLFALVRGVLRVDQSDGHRRIADQIRNTRRRIAAIREYIRLSAGKE